MKINWGWGLALGMVAFIAFIMYFVVTMTTSKEFDHDLVTEDYYAKEMVYQEEIDAETNVQKLAGNFKSERSSNGWKVTFPNSVNPSEIKGTAYLYRPSNEQLDFEIPLELNTNVLLIPDSKLIEGRWNITIDWSLDGEAYLYKKSITY